MLFVQLSVPALNSRLPDRFQPTANAVPTVVFSINFFFQYVKERLSTYKYSGTGVVTLPFPHVSKWRITDSNR